MVFEMVRKTINRGRKKMKKYLRRLSFWTWELPQSLLGTRLIIFYVIIGNFKKVEKFYDTDLIKVVFKKTRFSSSSSLGRFIFIQEDQDSLSVHKHEYGHSRQSLYLGWLYLIIVGLPSLYNNIRGRFVGWDDYYDRFPENWADREGEKLTNE